MIAGIRGTLAARSGDRIIVDTPAGVRYEVSVPLGVLERLPGLRIAFAHGGGAFPASIGRIEHGFNARPDLCAVDNDVNPRAYLDKIYLDTLVHDPLMLEYLLRLMGPERLALGSDYPFPLGEAEPGALIEATVSDDNVKARLLHGTALEWLNLDKARFV